MLLAARLGALRPPERTGELLLTAVATTGMVAPGLGTAAGAGDLGTAAGTTVAADTPGAEVPEAAVATTGLTPVAGRGLEASEGDLLAAPAEAAAAAMAAFTTGSAGVVLP